MSPLWSDPNIGDINASMEALDRTFRTYHKFVRNIT
uniref:Uncharacterized protein n=1 Tax=Arundo donax TaxID=35708 RepID=A0A0A8ZCJ7_ARUDO